MDDDRLRHGRARFATHSDADTGKQRFGYDGLNRVTGSTGLSTANTFGYTYDRDGNRHTQTAGNITFTYAYDRTDELLTVQKGTGAVQSFTYDSLGNMTGDAETGAAVTAYAYDLGNKLAGIDAANTANDASYTYDALGRVRARTVGVTPSPVVTDTYSYAAGGPEAVRIATGGVNLDSVVAPSGDRLAAASGGTANWFLADLHGSVAGTLSADQATVTSATRYDAWGSTIATGTAGGTAVGASAWKYRGRLDISPSGLGTPLYVMGARLYDPGVAAFTSLDTHSGKAQDPRSMNRFLYAAANPATLIDPTGHDFFGININPLDALGAVASTAVGVVASVGIAAAASSIGAAAVVAGAVAGAAAAVVTDAVSGNGFHLDHAVSGAAAGATAVAVFAAAGAVGDLVQQGVDVAAGTRDGIDLGEVAVSAGLGGVLGWGAAKVAQAAGPGIRDALDNIKARIADLTDVKILPDSFAVGPDDRGPQFEHPTSGSDNGAQTPAAARNRPDFRVKTSEDAIAAAPKSPVDGKPVCPGCGEPIGRGKVFFGGRLRIDFDLDHFGVKWSDRIKSMPSNITRPAVIDEYQRNVRAMCPICNQSHRFEE